MSSSGNIEYTSPNIEAFYRSHRIRWDQFYQSERVVFEQIGLGAGSAVLDIGCGCGGLGLALREKFGVTNYTGVEINKQAADTARSVYPLGRFIAADILAPPSGLLGEGSFDMVASLGCIDWNLEFESMLRAAWRYVKPGGYVLSSYRLTTGPGINDMTRSFQHINFDGKKEGETAPYVVLNAGELVAMLKALDPSLLRGFGYAGPPSASAVTPFEEVVFCVIAAQKRAGETAPTALALDLPASVLAVL